MKKLSLQWRITLITAILISSICVILNFLLYQNGIYFIDSLENTVIEYGDSSGEMYFEIPEGEWNSFAEDFSIQVYNTKDSYRNRSIFITLLVTVLGSAITYFVSGHMLKPLHRFSKQVNKVQAKNMTDCTINADHIPEFDQLASAYNNMLFRLSKTFEIQQQFTGNVAHELRTPLAVIQAQLDLYENSVHTQTNEDAVEALHIISEQTSRLIKLVKTLLDMSEMQTIPRNDSIELKALVEEVLTDLEPLAAPKNIQLYENCNTLNFTGSDILIYRLVYNLVENAIKYNQENGTVQVTSNQQNNMLILSVSDTGYGISEEDQQRVFEPFFRVDKSRSRATGGVGLGLALVNEIIALHGGSISLEKNSYGGTTFVITLPII